MKKTLFDNISEAKKTTLRRAVIVILWLLVWQLLAMIVHNKLLLASPLQSLAALMRLLGQGSFYMTILGSLGRIVLGFLTGLGVGLAAAAAAGRNKLVEDILQPVVRLLTTVPIVCFVVLLLIWWGASMLAAVVCFLVVFPIVYQNTLAGIKAVDPAMLEMAEVFQIPFGSRLWYLYRPALEPFWNSALKLSLGMCWKAGVAAEVIGTPDYSIGERIYLSKVYLDTADLFAWTAAVIVLSVLLERFILSLAERFYAWEPECKAAGIMSAERAAKNGDSDSERLGSNAVQISALSKTYGETIVFDGLNKTIGKGETVRLREASGSGKTTLLRLIAGLEQPEFGTIVTSGRCNMLFQEDRLCSRYTALKNVELITGDRKRAREALQQVLPGEALHKPCGQLSGGMRRRVALVRAMEADSDIVLLDEPFNGLDAAAREKAEEYIRRSQKGRTVIIASHI